MPLAKVFTKHVTSPRKTVMISLAIGAFFLLVFTTITTSATWKKREVRNEHLASYTSHFVQQEMDDLHQVLMPMQPWTQSPCQKVSNALTARTAFTSNVRAILLVRDGKAFCSSATGEMSLDIYKIAGRIDWNKSIDVSLISGTPMLPGKPAIVLWLKNPTHPGSGIFTTLNIDLTPWFLLVSREQDIAGLAISTAQDAISTWQPDVFPRRQLLPDPLHKIDVSGYPITVWLYGDKIPLRDIHMILLAGLLLFLVVTLISFLILSLCIRPGKEIMQGIKRGEFHVEYQAVVHADSGATCGLEALLRWTHPQEGRIPPDAFIAYAEGQNLIIPLTRHLFELVARDAHQLQHVLPKGTKMGVNLSPPHLTSASFREDVKMWIDAMPQGHFNYVFEITERAMVTEDNADAVFDWIHQQGIEIAIDDFGTGHSALIYLEKFKFDYLKIDRGFVQSIGRETVTSPVLDTVLNLAKKLNLNTVAEGVETAEQVEWLIERGVTYLQGYYFGHPQSAKQVAQSITQPESFLSQKVNTVNSDE